MRLSGSTIIGICLGISLMAIAIGYTTTNYAIFISVSSAIIVLGGVLAALFVSYHFRDIVKMFSDCIATIFANNDKRAAKKDIIMLVDWAKEIREQGPSILEDKMEQVKYNDFCVYALTLASSKFESAELYTMLENFIDAKHQRDDVSVHILLSMASFAPAFGMIGTLIGLIVMLDGLGGDPSKLGSGLALALTTTLYGVIFANLFFKPLANKIKINNQLVRERNLMLAEGFVLLVNQTDPLVLQDKLNSFLDVKSQFDMFSDDNI